MILKTKEDHEALPHHLEKALYYICLWEDVAMNFTQSHLVTYGHFIPEDAEKALQELWELGWIVEWDYPREWFSFPSQPYNLSPEARPYLRTIWRTVR